MQNVAKVSTVSAGSVTLGVPVGPRQQCTNAFSFARTRRRNLPSSERVWELAESTTSCEYTVTILQEQRAADIHDEVGQRSLERLFPGLTEDSVTQATLSKAQASFGIGYKRARDVAAPALFGALIAQIFVCVVTRSTNAEVQNNDMMMWTNVQMT